MAGLSNFIANKGVQQTTMPSWYDTAQQNLVNQATSAYGAAPQLSGTVAQGAINTLQPGATNPFTQAQNTLQSISSGAANPWITSPTGQITPNTQTALGGLFQAQNQQLEQLMPNITAPVTGSSINAGQFGSLRGQTATNKAMADAQAQLFANQMDAALKNQATGVTGASSLGNVAQQGITNAMNVGQAQQLAPFTNVANLGKILSGVTVPTTVTSDVQMSPLSQITAIASALGGGAAGANKLLQNLGVKGGLNEAFTGIGNILGGGSGLTAAQNPGGFTFGGSPDTQAALNSGMAPLDEEGGAMPGWSQSPNGTWNFSMDNLPSIPTFGGADYAPDLSDVFGYSLF
jgi:hypothetical protein